MQGIPATVDAPDQWTELSAMEDVWDEIPVGLYVCDRQGEIAYFNRAAVELWGRAPRPRDRYCGSYKLFRPDGSELAHADCLMAEVLRTGEPVRSGLVVIGRQDGSRILARVDINPIFDGRGEISGAVNRFRPALFDPEMRSVAGPTNDHALLAALPVAVYTTDAAGRLTFFNDAAARLWGHHPPLGEAEFCGSWRLFFPDGSPMRFDQCPMAQALRERVPVRGETAIAERPDGSRVTFLAYPTPLLDEAGDLIGGINLLLDLSDYLRTQRAAQTLAAIVESSSDAILSKDLNGVIISWNDAAERLFGYTAEEAVGHPVTMLIPEERLDEEPEILRRIRNGERVEHFETIRRRKDGTLVPISLTISPVRGSDGRIVGASKIARDISDKKRAEEQQQLLTREISHRAKNVFALASGLVTMSARNASSVDQLAETVRGRLNALAKAHDLVRPDPEDLSSPDRPTDLRELLEVIVSPHMELQSAAESGRVAFEGAALAISGDGAATLGLVFHEFATNAAKYGALASPEGRIEISWAIDGDRLRLYWVEELPDAAAGSDRTSEGFGTRLVRQCIHTQLAGDWHREWTDRGLRIRLSVPLEGLGVSKE